MITTIFLLIISLLASSIIPNLIREFIPFFMISTIIIISTFNIDEKRVYLTTFIFGILYDLLYTDLVLFHGFIFIAILFLSKLILNNSKNFILIFLTYYLSMILYSIIMYLFSFLYTNINIVLVIKLVGKSFFINTIFFVLTYLLFIGIKCLISNRKKTLTY